MVLRESFIREEGAILNQYNLIKQKTKKQSEMLRKKQRNNVSGKKE